MRLVLPLHLVVQADIVLVRQDIQAKNVQIACQAIISLELIVLVRFYNKSLNLCKNSQKLSLATLRHRALIEFCLYILGEFKVC